MGCAGATCAGAGEERARRSVRPAPSRAALARELLARARVAREDLRQTAQRGNPNDLGAAGGLHAEARAPLAHQEGHEAEDVAFAEIDDHTLDVARRAALTRKNPVRTR